jgi:formate hydrogenlyase transcriptional activator
LNVFPIQMPALRDRADDIPLLVAYLIGRYSKKAGKRFTNVTKKTLDMLKAYSWPGNIRELQNIVERAVVLGDSETFSVDEAWLREESVRTTPQSSSITGPFMAALADGERRMIEAALAECQGRISGPTGAAARLGIPRQTLDSKIAVFGIDKRRFKAQPVS